MAPFHIEPVRDESDLADALRVRMEVFVEEQHVPVTEEVDRYDSAEALDVRAVHMVGRLDGVPVATGRLLLEEHRDTLPHIGRVAVLAEHRSRGFGRALMEALHAAGRARGYSGATLAAQLHATGFYERLGYTAYGPTFIDAGIEHRQMDLRWGSAGAGDIAGHG